MKKSLVILSLAAATAAVAQDCIVFTAGTEPADGQCYTGMADWAGCFKKKDGATGTAPAKTSVDGFWQYWEQYNEGTGCVAASTETSSSSTETSSASTDNSSTSTETSSASTASNVNIDDFEEGAGKPAKTGTSDYWYAFANGTGSSIGNASDGASGKVVNFDAGTCGSSSRCAGITNIVVASSGSAALGVNIAGGLPGCTAISYKYKGAAHNLKPTMKGDEEGALTKWNQHKAAVTAASDWTPITVQFSQFVQEDWGGEGKADLVMANVNAIKWEVTSNADYLYVDDVNCVGYDPSAANSSSSNDPTGTAVVIDDFSDTNTTAETLGATAYWYIYTDKATVSNTQDANQTWDMVVTESGNSYIAMKNISGITSGSTSYPSAGIGIDFGAGVFTNCTAIQYDYKGSGHHMRGSITGVTKNMGYEHSAPNQDASTAWKTVTVSTMTQPDWVATNSASDVKPFSWATVEGLAWVVDEKLTQANIGTELAIDNVKCVGTLSTATTPTSSPSSANSIAVTSVAPAGLNVSLMGNTLQVTVAKAGVVKVQVFDMMGHAIESHSESMAAGSFAHTFGSMSKGFYVVRVQQGSLVKTMRMQVR